MEILRKCYKEADVKANAPIIQMRFDTIEKIMENQEIFSDEIWDSIDDYVIKGADIPEERLFSIEEVFCEEDNNFSTEGARELRVLMEYLWYRWIKDNENIYTLLEAVCAKHYQMGLESAYINNLILNDIADRRKAYRRIESKTRALQNSGYAKIKKSIDDEKNELANSADFEYTVDHLDVIFSTIGNINNNVLLLSKKTDEIMARTKKLEEESDYLWCMTNCWSRKAEMAFSKMSTQTLAAIIPFDLFDLSKWSLTPYATEQILEYILGRFADGVADQTVCIKDVVEKIPQNYLQKIEFSEINVTEVQLILKALQLKAESENNWATYFNDKTGRNAEDISFDDILEFSKQLLLEIELGYWEQS